MPKYPETSKKSLKLAKIKLLSPFITHLKNLRRLNPLYFLLGLLLLSYLVYGLERSPKKTPHVQARLTAPPTKLEPTAKTAVSEPTFRQPEASPKLDLPAKEDLYYGVYLNEHKVGYLHTLLETHAEQIKFTLEMVAKLRTDGQNQELNLQDIRIYMPLNPAATSDNFNNWHLQSFKFSEKTKTTNLQITGELTKNTATEAPASEFTLNIISDNHKQKQQVNINENLLGVVALRNLAKQARLGDKYQTSHFDPSLLKSLEVEHRTNNLTSTLLNGVPTKTIEIVSDYPSLGIQETSILNGQGVLLETHIGGFFTARLEPKELAKETNYAFDLLRQSALPLPADTSKTTLKALKDPLKLKRLSVTLSGFPSNFSLYKSARQSFSNSPKSVTSPAKNPVQSHTLTLLKESLPAKTPLETGKVNPALQEYLTATPFIQSKDPDIQKAAHKALNGTTDVLEATKKLVYFVRDYVQDEYLPAYASAKETLLSRRGDCTEYSNLFVALARSVNIPAKIAVGLMYSPEMQSFAWHAWAEVYIHNEWYGVDPTFGQIPIDVTHIKLGEGEPVKQAKIIMLLGQLKLTEITSE